MEPVTRQPGARVLGPPQPVRIEGFGCDSRMPSDGIHGAPTPGWTSAYSAPHQQGVMSAAEFDWGETIVAQLKPTRIGMPLISAPRAREGWVAHALVRYII